MGGLTNVFGAMVIVPVAVISAPSVPPREREKIMGRSVAYQKAFERTHNRKAWKKRVLTAVSGSLLGAIVNGLVIEASGY